MAMTSTTGGRQPIEEEIVMDGLSLPNLREQFTLADDSTRVIALVSPT